MSWGARSLGPAKLKEEAYAEAYIVLVINKAKIQKGAEFGCCLRPCVLCCGRGWVLVCSYKIEVYKMPTAKFIHGVITSGLCSEEQKVEPACCSVLSPLPFENPENKLKESEKQVDVAEEGFPISSCC